jgi:hypothetical protein
MKKHIYYYQDSKAMTREILRWLHDNSSHGCLELDLSANSALEVEASDALIKSVAAETIKSLQFHEIYFTPQQLKDLLTMPALEELIIWGGESSDWSGPTYIWETLGPEHIDVITSSPDAQRLRVLEIGNQRISEKLGDRLRAALPNLKRLRVERENY